jgi:hypothetical protein
MACLTRTITRTKQGEIGGQGPGGGRSDSQMAMQLHQELNEAADVPRTLPPVTRSDSDMARALQAELDGTAQALPVYQGSGMMMPAGSVVQGAVVGVVSAAQGPAVTAAGGYTALLHPPGGRERTDSAANAGVPAGICVPPHFNVKETMALPLLCGLLVAGGDVAILSKSIARVLTLVTQSKMLSPVQGQLRKAGYTSAVAAAFGNNLKVTITIIIYFLGLSLFSFFSFFLFFFFIQPLCTYVSESSSPPPPLLFQHAFLHFL